MTEGTIGQALREARQAKGLTLEQVAAETHIRPRFLEALETGDFQALPSLVQGRGFLRLYAGALGLDPVPLLAVFGRPATEVTTTPLPQSPEPAEPAPEGSPLTETPEPAEAAEDLKPNPEAPLFDEVEAARSEKPPSLQQSQRIYQEIGERLRAQRELLSLPLSDVENYIHVRSRYLESLEAGRMEDLPSPVQGRGMLANYAHFLNLDTEALLLRYAEALQARRVELAPPVPEEKRRPPVLVARHPALKRFLSVDLFLATGLLALLVVFIIWGTRQVLYLKGETTPTAIAPGISEMLMTSPAATPQETPTPESSAPAVAETNARGDPTETAAISGEPQETATVEVTVQAGAGGALKIGVIASQRVWLQVTVDGQVKFSGRTLPGGSYTFEGDEQIELLTGNAAGLQVFFNQNDMGVLGNIGQVVNMIYTSQGVILPTARPTSTSLPRPAATSTKPASPTTLPNSRQ